MNTRPRQIQRGSDTIPDEYSNDVFSRAEKGLFTGMTSPERVIADSPISYSSKNILMFEGLKVSIQQLIKQASRQTAIGGTRLNDLNLRFAQCQSMAASPLSLNKAISMARALRHELQEILRSNTK